MSEELSIEEHVVILSAEAAAEDRGARFGIAGVRVIHRYGRRVMIVAGPPEQMRQLRDAAPDAMIHAAHEGISDEVLAGLDPGEALGLEAFRLRQSTEYRKAKAQRPHDGVAWDAEGRQPPRALVAPDAMAAAGESALGGGTSDRMNGSVAVGIIIVSGPTPDLAFSSAERAKVVAEVQAGNGWLAGQNVAGQLSWTHDVRPVTINARPGTSPNEALWRNPAMAALGYSPDLSGVAAYVRAIKQQTSADWAYAAFFVKYPVDHFAYAYIGGPYMVMDYANDGWHPDNIDRLFAHETGHVFNAPDEYQSSGCNCAGNWGWFGQPNANCANCAENAVDCIMKVNSWQMCNYTTWHLGFRFPNGLTINGSDSTANAPSGCMFNGTRYLFWQANDSSNGIYQSGSGDGRSWSAGQLINSDDSTPCSPASVEFQGRLYLFWRANDFSNGIYFSASSDGASWPAGNLVNGVDSTPSAPAACAFNGKLYLFWQANDSSQAIYFSASSDGATWPAGTLVNGGDSTPGALAACAFDGKLYLFWQANDSSNRIYYSASTDSVSWSSGQIINNEDSTSATPAACASGGNSTCSGKPTTPPTKSISAARPTACPGPPGASSTAPTARPPRLPRRKGPAARCCSGRRTTRRTPSTTADEVFPGAAPPRRALPDQRHMRCSRGRPQPGGRP